MALAMSPWMSTKSTSAPPSPRSAAPYPCSVSSIHPLPVAVEPAIEIVRCGLLHEFTVVHAPNMSLALLASSAASSLSEWTPAEQEAAAPLRAMHCPTLREGASIRRLSAHIGVWICAVPGSTWRTPTHQPAPHRP